MIYKFRSKAAGDLVMTGPEGDRVLRAMGREPAPQGIVEAAALTTAIDALEAAIAAEGSAAADDDEQQKEQEGRAAPLSLRRRAWPMIEMLRRAREARVPVVWGV